MALSLYQLFNRNSHFDECSEEKSEYGIRFLAALETTTRTRLSAGIVRFTHNPESIIENCWPRRVDDWKDGESPGKREPSALSRTAGSETGKKGRTV